MKNTKQIWVDKTFDAAMRDIMGDRLNKKLAKPTMRDMGMPEGSRLLMKCPSWANVEKELRTLPKKKQ